MGSVKFEGVELPWLQEKGQGGSWWRYGNCVLGNREDGCLNSSKIVEIMCLVRKIVGVWRRIAFDKWFMFSGSNRTTSNLSTH